MYKRDVLKALRKRNKEPIPEWPAWLKILVLAALLAFCGRVAWIAYMG